MKRYLSQEEHRQLGERLARSEARLTIPRSVARQFFTRVDNASIVDTTGESMMGQKIVIWLGILLPFAMFVGCLLAIIYYFGWMATIGAPLVGIFWTVLAGLTGDRGTMIHGWVGLAAAIALALVMPVIYALPLLLFAISLWLQRMNFMLAEYWVTALVIRSFPAYDMLIEYVEIEEFEPSPQPA